VSALSELLSTVNGGRLSARAVARAARAQGHSLNHDTAARYLRGDHGRPDEATLVALAEVLDVSLAQLRAAAGLPSELTDPYVPPAEASRLTRRQRLAVDELIRAMLDPGAAATARPSGTVDTADTADRDDLSPRRERRTTPRDKQASRLAPGDRAARHGDPEPPSD
jgi:transcriptional regulator with XRE-family HTH domain